MSRAVSIALTLAVFACGCSSKKEGPAPGEHPLASVDGFCAAWAEAACSTAVVDACVASTEESCRDSQVTFCLTLDPPGNHDPDTAEGCIDAVRSAYSDAVLTAEEYATVRSLATPCDQLQGGPDASLIGSECAAGDSCGSALLACAPSADDPTSYTCQELVARSGGQTCGAINQTCEAGFYCEPDDGVSTRYCIERPALGVACTLEAPCREDLYCDPLTETCRAKLGRGEPCLTHEECDSGICLGADAGSEGICVDEVDLGPTDEVCTDLR